MKLIGEKDAHEIATISMKFALGPSEPISYQITCQDENWISHTAVELEKRAIEHHSRAKAGSAKDSRYATSRESSLDEMKQKCTFSRSRSTAKKGKSGPTNHVVQ